VNNQKISSTVQMVPDYKAFKDKNEKVNFSIKLKILF